MAVRPDKNGIPRKQKAVYKPPQKEKQKMATHPTGKGTKTIGLNMKLEIAKELERRAESMCISTGAYCKIILNAWLQSGKKVTLKES